MIQKAFAGILGFLGNLTAASPSTCCFFWALDEPECPKSLLD